MFWIFRKTTKKLYPLTTQKGLSVNDQKLIDSVNHDALVNHQKSGGQLNQHQLAILAELQQKLHRIHKQNSINNNGKQTLKLDSRLTEELKELLASLPYKRPVCPVCKNNDFITGVSMGMQREAQEPWNKYKLTSQGKSMGGCVLDYGIPAWKCLRCNDRFNSDMSVFVELEPYGES